MATVTEHPWLDKPWAPAAEAANTGLGGQGYIVHSMMHASRVGTRLTVAIILLMLVQIGVAVLLFNPSASDGRAWVLWATAPDASFHTPIAGWEDQHACARDMKKRNLEPEQPGQKRAVYFCLPDTVDPRGPKGGSR